MKTKAVHRMKFKDGILGTVPLLSVKVSHWSNLRYWPKIQDGCHNYETLSEPSIMHGSSPFFFYRFTAIRPWTSSMIRLIQQFKMAASALPFFQHKRSRALNNARIISKFSHKTLIGRILWWGRSDDPRWPLLHFMFFTVNALEASKCMD